MSLSGKFLKVLGLISTTILIELYFAASLPAALATHVPPNAGSCGDLLTVTTSENPSCDGEVNPNMSSHTAVYHVQSKGQTFSIHYNTHSFFCTDPFPHDGGDPNRHTCLQSRSSLESYAQVLAGGSIDIPVSRTVQNACGSVQTDLSFDVIQNGQKICSYGNLGDTINVGGWSFCSTGQSSCEIPTPFPTTPIIQVITPTPTPVVIITTPTVTPSPLSTIQQQTACSNISQSGVNSNINCQILQQQQNGTQNSSQNGTQIQTNTQNSTVVLTPAPVPVVVAAASQQQEVQRQQVFAALAPAPIGVSQLPSTGSQTPIFLGLIGLIPLGLTIKKFS